VTARDVCMAIVGRKSSGLRGEVLMVGALRTLGAGALMAMHMVVAQRLGATEYGEFTLALAVAGTAAMLAPLGWPVTAVRFVAVYVSTSSHDLLRGFLRASHLVTLAGGLAAGAVLLISVPWLPASVGHAVSLASFLTPLWALSFLRIRTFQGLGRMPASLIPEQIVLPVAAMVAAWTLHITSASGYIVVLIVAHATTLLLQTSLLHSSADPESASATPRFELRLWWATSLPLVISGAGRLLLNRADVMMLGAMRGPAITGIYGAANRLSLLVVLGMTAITMVLMPRIASDFASGDRDSFRRTLRTAYVLGAASGGIPAVLLCAFPNLLLMLFGQEFADGENLLRVLVLGGFVTATIGAATAAMAMIGEQRWLAHLTLAAVVMNVVGNAIVIPRYGATGAAVASVLSLLVIHVPSVFIVHRRAHES